MNNLKTALMLTVLTVLLVWVGGALGGGSGALFAFVFALAMNLGSYWWSDRIVLRMYRAHPVTADQAPELVGMVADLAQRAELPTPSVYVIPSPALNAFATGRNPKHAAVAVTDGLLQRLDPAELRGVIAHELSHVKHRDILIGSIVAVIAGALSLLQWVAIFGGYGRGSQGGGAGALLALVAALIAAPLIQFAISRSREFEADAGSARITGDPSGLIAALRKLELGSQRVPLGGSQATAHMFIVNPLHGGAAARLFRTHPSTEDRIERLSALIGVPHLR